MKTFKGNRKFDEICDLMKNKGMEIDSTEFDKGGDWINFKGGWHRLPLTIIFNVCNGQFYVYNGFTGKKIATHMSEELENEKWYDDLLNTLYVA